MTLIPSSPTISRYDWFHTIDFGNGVVTKGHCSAASLEAKADCYFSVPHCFAGGQVGTRYWLLGWLFQPRSASPRRLPRARHRPFRLARRVGPRAFRSRPRAGSRPSSKPRTSTSTTSLRPRSGPSISCLFTGVLYHTRHPLVGARTRGQRLHRHASGRDRARRYGFRADRPWCSTRAPS